MSLGIKSKYETWKLFMLNPCDIDTVVPGGKLFTWLHSVTETNCPCCSGARVFGLMLLAFGVGYVV